MEKMINGSIFFKNLDRALINENCEIKKTVLLNKLYSGQIFDLLDIAASFLKSHRWTILGLFSRSGVSKVSLTKGIVRQQMVSFVFFNVIIAYKGTKVQRNLIET